MEEIRREELEEQTVELLPDREEMNWRQKFAAVAVALEVEGRAIHGTHGLPCLTLALTCGSV